ncbi:MAG: transposase [Proteobacteria bacterium]|nr:transposase [Pseudomonadota bacterium]
MEGVRDRALAYVAGQALDLPGLLGRTARDWHIVDATTVRLADALMDEYPGAGAYAALKVHKRYSVGMGTTVAYHLSPAREHDAPHLKLDESWRGLGLLVDLGYASLKLLSSCDRYGVSYVLRLKENWKPKVLHVARGSVSRTFAPGTDLDLLLQREVLKLDGKVIDADVELWPWVARGRCTAGGRLDPKGVLLLSNQPRSRRCATCCRRPLSGALGDRTRQQARQVLFAPGRHRRQDRPCGACPGARRDGRFGHRLHACAPSPPPGGASPSRQGRADEAAAASTSPRAYGRRRRLCHWPGL